MTMKKANEVAVAYTQKYDRFLKKEKQLLQLVRGTFLEQEMRELGDQVEEAWELNIDAGWLPEDGGEFAPWSYVEALIKHDYRGTRFSSLSDLPQEVRGEFPFGEEEFTAHITKLRTECRSAYEQMEAISIEAPDLVDDDGVFETLESLGEEAGLSERDQEFITTLGARVESWWKSYLEEGYGLIHMANEINNTDYDPTLMQALLFD
tara:strand:- start:5138 stop:5758 length:621 start_codon:yes stop_codon:yes gene_type:complete